MTDAKKVKFYKSRKKGGGEQVYSSAEKLLDKAFEYFAWCEDNPWYKKELMRSGDRKGEIVEVPIHRPYTVVGLCVYCGMSEKTFAVYAADPKMSEAVDHISHIIKQNQLEGAVIGAYNSSLVARLLGLADSSDTLGLSQGQSLTIQVAAPTAKNELEGLKHRLLMG